MATAAIIGAIASVIGAGTSVASTLGRSNAQPQAQFAIQERGLRDAEANDAYQRALSVLTNQRAVAGYQDTFGSGLRYDPATNQWVSTLGQLPRAAQTASDQASILRNTIDLRNEQFANQQAMERAARAGPAADAAQRNLADFRPMTGATLTDLLTQKAVDANNLTYNPLIADTERAFQRQGTAAGPVLSQLARSQAGDLRRSLIDAQISGMTGAEGINTQRRQGLETQASTTAGLANPQLQSSQLDPNNPGAALASLLAQRAQAATLASSYGATGVNAGNLATQGAIKSLASSVPDQNFGSTQLGTVGKDISGLFGSGSNVSNFLKNEFSKSGGYDVFSGSGPFSANTLNTDFGTRFGAGTFPTADNPNAIPPGYQADTYTPV